MSSRKSFQPVLFTTLLILVVTTSLTLASTRGKDTASPVMAVAVAPDQGTMHIPSAALPAVTNAPDITTTKGPSNPYYSEEIITLSDGRQLVQARINGPAQPPPGHELERTPVAPSVLNRPGVASSLAVPAYDWVFGCSAVSASMIGAYFDRNGLANIYTGPANGGVMPMDNSIWPTWVDGAGETYPANPLAASRLGLDGRSIKGSIDDYWVAVDSTAPDPYISGGWTQHTWGNAFGDYMKTSQSAHDNPDGSTYFSWWLSGLRYTCAQMEEEGDSIRDGAYGRKSFYEARGYTVRAEDCYNQLTDNQTPNGFTFNNYKAQIDAGYPVLLNLKGHSIVGVGYAEPSTVYIHDTWDYLTHQMTWGGSYADMVLQSVSVVNPLLSNPVPVVTSLTPASAAQGGASFTLTVNGNNFFMNSVVRWNGADRTTTFVSSTRLTAQITAADIASAATVPVTVFNPAPGGGTSSAIGFVVTTTRKVYIPLVLKSNPAAASWATLVSTNFEGAWPGPWQVADDTGPDDDEYYWGKRSCRAYSGSNSGWAIGAGAQGSALGCGANYPNNAESWMIYGPFDLSGATAAHLTFQLWLDTEIDYDGVCRFASVDGSQFWGNCTTGDTNGWSGRTLDLKNVYQLGNLLGQPRVWVAIIFSSDESNTFAEGAYVDDVIVRKCPSGATCPVLTGSTPAASSQLLDRPAHLVLPR